MKIVIVGCGRVGAAMAEIYDRSGHKVVILDISTSAFDRLPSSFGGQALRGDGTDEDVLRRAGAEGADVFLALTEGDNRNVMAAQLAAEALGIGNVVAKINDPVRAEAYAELGIATICRTGLMMDAVDRYLGLPAGRAARMLAPTGRHDEQPRLTARRAGTGRSAAAAPSTPAGALPPASRAGRADHVRPGRRRRQGRLLPRQGAHRSGPRGRPHGEGPRRARQIADEIGSIVIAHDGCEGKYLGEAGCNRADVVAAVTGDDEDNLVICQMAKHHFDVPRTIARVNNPKNEALFRHLGVDELISPTRMILGSIEQDIPVHELLHLAALGEGELELIEAHLQAGSPAIGRAPQGPADPRGLLAVRGHPRRDRDPAPTGHGHARGRQGHRHRQAGVPGPAP